MSSKVTAIQFLLLKFMTTICFRLQPVSLMAIHIFIFQFKCSICYLFFYLVFHLRSNGSHLEFEQNKWTNRIAITRWTCCSNRTWCQNEFAVFSLRCFCSCLGFACKSYESRENIMLIGKHVVGQCQFGFNTSRRNTSDSTFIGSIGQFVCCRIG